MLLRFRASLVTALALGLPGQAARAEVPFQEAMGIYAHTDPEHRNLSPIWGMVALKGGLLSRIRFYGAYSATPDPRYPRHWLAERRECPADGASALLQHLFTNSSRSALVPVEAREDPIGQIAREARARREQGAQEGGLRRIQALLDAIVSYRRQLARQEPGAAGATEADRSAAAKAFGADVRRILARPGSGPASPEFDRRLKDFTRVLSWAVQEETFPRQATYPPDIVETALLAYAWVVADSAGELYDAFSDAITGGLLTPPAEAKAQARFSADAYDAHLASFLERLHRGGDGAPSPEEIALFAIGHRNYDGPVPHLPAPRTITYRDKDRHVASEYQDTNETFLRDFFIIVFHGRGGIDERRVAALLDPSKASPGPAPESKHAGGEAGRAPGRLLELRRFFQRFPAVDQQATTEAHEAWGALVSDLDHPGDPLPIDYLHGTHGIPPGLEPMLNVIAHLLPDPELNRPWSRFAKDRPREAALKLDRLCLLASRKGRELDWRVGPGKTLQDLKPLVVFRINGAPAFTWSLRPEAPGLAAYRQGHVEGWPGRALPDVRDFRLRSLLLPHQDRSSFPIDPGQHWQVFAADLENPRTPLELIDQLLADDNPAYLRLLQAMVRTVPWREDSLDRLAKVFEAHPGAALRARVYPWDGYLHRSEADKGELLLQALDRRLPYAARLLMDHKANVNGRDAQGEPLVFRAIHYGRLDMLGFLLKAGASVRVHDRDGSGPLAVAVRTGHNDLLRPLLKAGAGPVDGALARACVRAGNQEAQAILVAFLQEQEAGAGARGQAETKAADQAPVESKGSTESKESGPMSRRPESKRKP